MDIPSLSIFPHLIFRVGSICCNSIIKDIYNKLSRIYTMKAPLTKLLSNKLEELNIEFEIVDKGRLFLCEHGIFIDLCRCTNGIKQISGRRGVILIQGLNAARIFIKLLEGITAIDIPCPDTMSEDGGSCGEQIKCNGIRHKDGSFSGGCGEPCDFIMHGGSG